MHWITTAVNSFHRAVWDRVVSSSALTGGDIGSFRRIYTLLVLLLFFQDNMWLADIPGALFHPPPFSLAALFDGFPHYATLAALHLIIVCSLLSIGVGRYMKAAGLVYFGAMVALYGFRYSFGKIDHGILLPMVVVCFSLANWKADNWTTSNSLPIPGETLLAIVIAFGMLTAGLPKAVFWIDFDLGRSGFLHWFYGGYYSLGREALLAKTVFNFPPLLIELMDYLAVMFETGAFLALLSGKRVVWVAWLVMACVFHLCNILLLNITFLHHTLVYLPFLMPRAVTIAVRKVPVRTYTWLIVVVAGVQLVLLFGTDHTLMELLPDNRTLLYFSLVCWLIVTGLGVWRLNEVWRETPRSLRVLRANAHPGGRK